MREHFYKFNNKHEPRGSINNEKGSDDDGTGSALWLHSKNEHNGALVEDDWVCKITSMHKGALNRQITEGVRISHEGLDNILNLKNEFGANTFTETILVHGNKILGNRPDKRKRTNTETNIKIEPHLHTPTHTINTETHQTAQICPTTTDKNANETIFQQQPKKLKISPMTQLKITEFFDMRNNAREIENLESNLEISNKIKGSMPRHS